VSSRSGEENDEQRPTQFGVLYKRCCRDDSIHAASLEALLREALLLLREAASLEALLLLREASSLETLLLLRETASLEAWLLLLREALRALLAHETLRANAWPRRVSLRALRVTLRGV